MQSRGWASSEGPPKRWAHSLNSCGQGGAAILFGGFSGTYLNDAWVLSDNASLWNTRLRASDSYDKESSTWQPMEAGASDFYPCVRSNHAAIEMGHIGAFRGVIVHGGSTKKDRFLDAYWLQLCVQSTGSYMVQHGSQDVGLVSQRIDAPMLPKLSFHAGCIVSCVGGVPTFVLFGGADEVGQDSSSLYSISLAGGASQVPGVQVQGTSVRKGQPVTGQVELLHGAGKLEWPCARRCHAMSTHSGTGFAVLCGGALGDKFKVLPQNEFLWLLSTADLGFGKLNYTWMRPATEVGALPTQRWGHSLVCVNGTPHFLMIAGNIPAESDSGKAVDCSTVTVLSLVGQVGQRPAARWSQIAPITPDLAPRRRFGAALIRDSLIVYGGYGATGYFSDIAVLAQPFVIANAAYTASARDSPQLLFGGAAAAANAFDGIAARPVIGITGAAAVPSRPVHVKPVTGHKAQTTLRILGDMGYASARTEAALNELYLESFNPQLPRPDFMGWAESVDPDSLLEYMESKTMAKKASSIAEPGGTLTSSKLRIATEYVPVSERGSVSVVAPASSVSQHQMGGAGAAELAAAAAATAALQTQLKMVQDQLRASQARLTAAEADVKSRETMVHSLTESASKTKAELFSAKRDASEARGRIEAVKRAVDHRDGWFKAQMARLTSKCMEKLDAIALCSMCLDTPRCVFTLPCAHMGYCVPCFNKMGGNLSNKGQAVPQGVPRDIPAGGQTPTCPLCNQAVAVAYKVHLISKDSLDMKEIDKIAATKPPPLE